MVKLNQEFSFITALYIILSRDVPLSKSNFFSRSESLFGLSVGIGRAVEESNPPRYKCRQELMDSKVQSFINQCFIVSYDKTGLNLKFERAFFLVLENTLGPSAVTHYNRNTHTNYQLESQWCPDGRVV